VMSLLVSGGPAGTGAKIYCQAPRSKGPSATPRPCPASFTPRPIRHDLEGFVTTWYKFARSPIPQAWPKRLGCPSRRGGHDSWC
jgi:hypothetical protein